MLHAAPTFLFASSSLLSAFSTSSIVLLFLPVLLFTVASMHCHVSDATSILASVMMTEKLMDI